MILRWFLGCFNGLWKTSTNTPIRLIAILPFVLLPHKDMQFKEVAQPNTKKINQLV